MISVLQNERNESWSWEKVSCLYTNRVAKRTGFFRKQDQDKISFVLDVQVNFLLHQMLTDSTALMY